MQQLWHNIQSVIFDMDGVLIDSMPFWQQAEATIFGHLGVPLSPEYWALTAAMTTTEVTRFWHTQSPWSSPGLEAVEQEVIAYVGQMIRSHGVPIPGIQDAVRAIHAKGYRLGLATNAPAQLIPVVLDKLELSPYFSVQVSGEAEEQGKPHPAIYLRVARQLDTDPAQCLVFEDSFFGVTAAKSAGMKVIALQTAQIPDPRLAGMADACIPHFRDLKW